MIWYFVLQARQKFSKIHAKLSTLSQPSRFPRYLERLTRSLRFIHTSKTLQSRWLPLWFRDNTLLPNSNENLFFVFFYKKTKANSSGYKRPKHSSSLNIIVEFKEAFWWCTSSVHRLILSDLVRFGLTLKETEVEINKLDKEKYIYCVF